jgi:2-C-methyl-D-erythritol 4-phosphate cytidylyltransferase
MYQGQRVGAIILMAGVGNRLGGEIPKQFLVLGGKKVYLHAADLFHELGLFDEIVLVCHPDWVDVVKKEVSYATIVLGGASRQQSSYLGLLGFKQKPDIVLIHDAARPFVSKSIVLENIAKASLYGAVDTCLPSQDTIVHSLSGHFIENIPLRSNYLRGQTPQTFRFASILEAHESALREGIQGVSDDCQLVLRRGESIYIVLGEDINFKITNEFDFKLSCFVVDLTN